MMGAAAREVRAVPYGARGARVYHSVSPFIPSRAISVTADTPSTDRKARIDAVLLKLAGVSAKKIGGMDAYVVGDRMFACISGKGVGLRLPVAVATELQFSRENVVPFQPGGMASTREWIQIDREEAADYEKDLELFQSSIDFVKAGRTR